ncbi:MAG: hypothetical protein AAB870_01155, partial [Patescibacteria group bacterium]
MKAILNDRIPLVSQEIKDTIEQYACGLPKIAIYLSQKQFSSGVSIELYMIRTHNLTLKDYC